MNMIRHPLAQWKAIVGRGWHAQLGFLTAPPMVLLLLTIPFASLADKSIINSDGVLEIDGKKIFVIGFPAAPPANAKIPTGNDPFADLADAAATSVRFGPAHPRSDAPF